MTFHKYPRIIRLSFMYIAGLMLLWCSKYLSPTGKIDVFYAAAVILAVGMAGQNPPLRAFLADQLSDEIENPTEEKQKEIDDRTNILWRVARFSGATIALVSLRNATREMAFGVSALVMGANLLLFLFGYGLSCYKLHKPDGSSSGIILRVLKAARRNRNRNYPQTEKGFYWKTLPQPGLIDKSNGQTCLKPKVLFLRRLDKAAVIDERTLPVSPKEQKEQVLGGHLCTAEQVREVKRLFTLIPIWTSFLGCSLVAATGNTFFYEQTSNMADNIKVEAHRLYLIEEENIDPMDSNQTISMSVLWLIPQFILLGLMEGLATEGLQEFFYNHVAISMRSYGPSFSECVLGFGNFISMPFVLLCRSWFKDSINTSHLDKYYLTLAILSFVCLVMYAYASYSLKPFHMGNASEEPLLQSHASTEAEEGLPPDEELKEILVHGTDGLAESQLTWNVSFPRRRNVANAAAATATESQPTKSFSFPSRSISLRLKDKKVGESAANVDSPEHMEEPLLQSHASTEAEEGLPPDDKPESHRD
ncbi:protein NRT1/ PTR FAMILY 5.4-like [Quercus lobata]|uniref:protein NRT1/ PTR FAMILY 5.4-like n=1 Tax=Quercus lobata TaxID=97700 RepID=UPI0012453762|nr:protein NRT1/ PTR FAMILY 5.4-like [Quercus lobata]